MPAPGGGGGSSAINNAAADQEAHKEYLKEMRGWLMTVATLFIGLAFQAVLNPPGWLNTEWLGSNAAASRGERLKATFYLMCNELTFATALVVVLFLLWTPITASAKHVLRYASALLTLLSVTVAFTFAVAATKSWAVTLLAFICTLCFANIAATLLLRMAAAPTLAPALPETS